MNAPEEKELKFRTIQVNDFTMVSLAFKDGFYYLNTCRQDKTLRARFTKEAMEAIMKLYTEIWRDETGT